MKQQYPNSTPAATPRENPNPRTAIRNVPPPSPRENPTKGICTSVLGNNAKENQMTDRIATGFDLEPLATGNVLIEFFGDDGKTFNTQVVTREMIESMPAVVGLTLVCMDQGREAVKKIMESVRPVGQDGE